ncbi:MAG: hypothetical protein OWU32_04430 [Firmicutes bacterium]|nr:hypothetical protein [Bacillota bacterium]
MKVEFGRMLRELDYLTELRVVLWERVHLRDERVAGALGRRNTSEGEAPPESPELPQLPGQPLPSYWTAETTASSRPVVVTSASGALPTPVGSRLRTGTVDPGAVVLGTCSVGQGEAG